MHFAYDSQHKNMRIAQEKFFCYALRMKKDALKFRLKRLDMALARLIDDLDLNATTPMRWDDVPSYALAYLIALEIMTPEQRLDFRHKLAIEKKGDPPH